jgi:hypothetical protein
MITREEYLKALEIVDQYNRQLNLSDVMISSNRETVDDFVKKNRDKFKTTRTEHILKGRENGCCWDNTSPRLFTYMDEVSKYEFMMCRNAGKKGWEELESIMNES